MMPCFLCKNINRGAYHIYGDVINYLCVEHNIHKNFNFHCDKFDPEPLMGVIARVLQDFDFYKEKLDLLDEYITARKTAKYVRVEVEDLQQGFDRVRREVEMLLASMQLWNYSPVG